MTDGAVVREAFRSSEWREVADELASALFATICVVDIESGATLSSTPHPFACDAILLTEPNPGLGCLRRTDRDLDPGDPEPVRGVCEVGIRAILAPVRFEGSTVCHAMVSGFVASTHERGRLLQQLLKAGFSDLDAREMVARIPVADRDRALDMVRVVVSRAERHLAEHGELGTRSRHSQEVSLLAEVARELGPVETRYGRIPEGVLVTLLKMSGADRAAVWLADPTDGSVSLAVRAGALAETEVDEALKAAADHALGTGRSLLTVSRGALAARRSVLAVPILRGGATGGALVLSKDKARPLAADDVRMAELFGETLGAVLDNASAFVAANTRLVELLQANEVARALNSTLDYDRLSELATHVLGKQLSFEAGGFVIDGFGERRGRVVHSLDVTRGELAGLLAEASGSEPQSGPPPELAIVGIGAELVEGQPDADREWTVLSRELLFHNVHAGDLFVASPRSHAFTSDDERVLGVLAAHMSVALENAVLYERLDTDFGRAIAALGALADATERLEHGHTDRVMDYAVAIGRELGLPIQRIGLLRFAGLLHDLGKVGLAEEILIKPSVLTEQEMALVRRHSEAGASIIEQVRVLDDLIPVVRHHHEHWDGSGYPGGLAGADIPLEARILSVADAYEAMTGKRVHRKRLSSAAARAELRRTSGTQFDPAIVDTFLTLLDRRALAGSTGLFADLANDARGPHLPA
ncbi:MAG TPA: HD domain-containing phosphohydrolase [Coriobacteriia bacterium]